MIGFKIITRYRAVGVLHVCPPANGLGHAAVGERVGALVARVPGVTPDPAPVHVVTFYRGLEPLPEVCVLDRLLGRRLPPVALPTVKRPATAVPQVHAVG